MSSTVEICNRALQKLGAKRIVSLTDDSVNARACNVAFEPIKLSELRNHPWSFAIKRASLAADATPPTFGFQNSFTLPSDFIRLMEPDLWRNANYTDWVIEQKKIFTNFDAPLEIRYIADVVDPNQMDTIFREALSCRLALELCEEITQSNSKKQDLKDDYKTIIQDARKTNAIEVPPQVAADDQWVDIRR